MTKKERERLQEEERLREKRELLKLRQGLIEESELIPQEVPAVEKPTGMKAVENFFYHYKWYIIVGAIALIIITYLTVQCATREKEDLYVLVVQTTNSSGLYMKQLDIEEALERYCPDFDGNGNVHVAINCINLSTESGVSEYSDAEQLKFSSEMLTGDSQFWVSDDGIIAVINDFANEEIQFFRDYSEEYPDAAFSEGGGLRYNSTGLKDATRWASCPDSVGIYVRDIYSNMTGNDDDAQEQRRRALEVYDNIVNDRVINPDKGVFDRGSAARENAE